MLAGVLMMHMFSYAAVDCRHSAPSAVVDRVEQEAAVLIAECGKQTVLPSAFLPDTVSEGDIVYIHVLTDDDATVLQKERMQQLLDQLADRHITGERKRDR